MNLQKRLLSVSNVIILAFLLATASNLQAQVGIASTSITADASAMLEVQSTSKGLLTPRMTNAQKQAISSPATGLTIFQTDSTAGYYVYTGSAWTRLLTATVPVVDGGTGASTKTAAFDNLSPMTTSGDIIYGGASGTGTRLAKGSDGQVLTLASGVPSWASAGSAAGGLIGVRVLTSGTSYTPTSGTTAIVLEMVGGGGGGGGADNQYAVGSGGGAGGYARTLITGIKADSTYTYSIGTGGAGGAVGTNGSAGTASTFATKSNSVPASTIFTTSGGSGGDGSTGGSKAAVIGGAGGASTSNTATKADVNYTGESGGYSLSRDNAEYNIAGSGANTAFGPGGATFIGNNSTNVAGNAGVGKGSGGGGAYAGSGTGASGGAGVAGVIVIYEYR